VTSEIAAGAALAAELLNTRARPARPVDTLDDFYVAHGGSIDELRALRVDLVRVFSSGDVEALNPWLSPPRLVPAASGFSLRAFDSVSSSIAFGLASLIAEHGLDRLGLCAASDCQCVYADTSPRGNRRFCSRTCATRTHVRTHRT